MKVIAKLENPTKIKSVDSSTIRFEDGSYLEHDHDASCCECNYADFDCVKDSILLDRIFDVIVLEEGDCGVLLNGYLINCYSEQNGWYSSSVDITYKNSNGEQILFLQVEGDLIER